MVNKRWHGEPFHLITMPNHRSNHSLKTYQTATQWGVYQVSVEDEQIVAVAPLAIDPDPSPLGQALVDGIQHPLRIKRPSVRRGWLQNPDRARHLRGNDEFVELPWDEALELAAGELQRVAEQHGNKSIFAGSYGWASAGRFNHAQSQLHRFINMMGGATRAMNSYSTAAAQVILPHVVAPWGQMELEQPSWQEIASGAELVVAFGGIPLRNTQVAYGGITEHQSAGGLAGALAAGVQFVNISPQHSDLPAGGQWLAPRPGTDVALMLGLAFELETSGAAKRPFLDKYCTGYDTFRDYLLGSADGQPKSPAWAASICDVPAPEIVALAQKMAGKRTFIATAWSLQRAHHGEQPYWMTVTLACMLGQVGLPGCGFGFGYGAEGFVGSSWRRFNWATLSKGRNPANFAIPVARIADMLLQPGAVIDYDGQRIEYPDTKLIYWAGGNPFHHHQDLNRLCQAWRQPDTVIVNEPWWTPVAQWADIVFPATTQLEREDICASSHDPYAHIMEQAIPPQHQARSDHLIFKGLAQQLGIEEQFTEGRNEREWMAQMWQRSGERAATEGFELPSFEQFWTDKQYRIPDAPTRSPWLSDFRADPKRHPLATPSGKIELFSATVAAFDYDDCPGHASWLEPFERLGGHGAKRFPLALISPQPERRLHSQLDHSALSQAGKVAGIEVMSMHPLAAVARGIAEGCTVRVFNDRGSCLASVVLIESLRPDVVSLPTGAWYRPQDPSEPGSLELAGNPNVLTRDSGTSKLAQGPSSGSCQVQVEVYNGATN
ncbi:MAG: biotin/methionine sulfoxide reductase [Paraglaciecola psychrophila]